MLKGLKSLITGIIAGTAIGVLFSPKEGKEVRKNLKKEIESGGTGLSTVKDTLSGMGKDIGDSSKKTLDKISKSDEYQEAKEKAKTTYGKAKKEVKKVVKKATKKAAKPKKK